MFADIQAAIQMEQRITKSKASMRDLLNKTCASYNKMTSIKKHRIDGARKSLLYNLCLSLFGDQLVLFFLFSPWILAKKIYVFTRVELCRDIFFYHDDGLIKGCDPQKTSSIWSTDTTIPILISNQAWFRGKKKNLQLLGFCQSGPGLPLEILAQEFWVPGSTVRAECPQYLGKELFSEILRVTDETACLYAFRASQDPWYTRTMFFIFVVVVLFCFPPKFGHTWFKIRLSQHFKSKQKKTFHFLVLAIPEDFERRASPEASLKVKDRGCELCGILT